MPLKQCYSKGTCIPAVQATRRPAAFEGELVYKDVTIFLPGYGIGSLLTRLPSIERDKRSHFILTLLMP